MGRSLPGRRAVVDSSGRHRALHHGPVFEPAESGGVRGNLHAVARTLETKYVRARCGSLLRPHASADGGVSVFVLRAARGDGKFESRAGSTRGDRACLLPLWIPLDPATSTAYHEAAKRHAYHYIQLWRGMSCWDSVAPLALFWWFGRVARARQWPVLERVCRAFVVYGLIYFVVGARGGFACAI